MDPLVNVTVKTFDLGLGSDPLGPSIGPGLNMLFGPLSQEIRTRLADQVLSESDQTNLLRAFGRLDDGQRDHLLEQLDEFSTSLSIPAVAELASLLRDRDRDLDVRETREAIADLFANPSQQAVDHVVEKILSLQPNDVKRATTALVQNFRDLPDARRDQLLSGLQVTHYERTPITIAPGHVIYVHVPTSEPAPGLTDLVKALSAKDRRADLAEFNRVLTPCLNQCTEANVNKVLSSILRMDSGEAKSALARLQNMGVAGDLPRGLAQSLWAAYPSSSFGLASQDRMPWIGDLPANAGFLDNTQLTAAQLVDRTAALYGISAEDLKQRFLAEGWKNALESDLSITQGAYMTQDMSRPVTTFNVMGTGISYPYQIREVYDRRPRDVAFMLRDWIEQHPIST
jgi:hypothetical protein